LGNKPTGKVAESLAHLSKSSLVRDDSGISRIYIGEDGHRYSSVTSIIASTDSERKREALAAWLERPGSAETLRNASERGTRAHANAEYIAKTGRTLARNAALKRNIWNICDDGLERCPKDITEWALKKAAASAPRVSWSAAGYARGLRHFLLDRVTAVHGAELKVSDKSVAAAGTFDLLADVDGELALVDWKTSHRSTNSTSY
jgi:ATP-dependent exoDNAse (exonuclease V) beta subunit